MSFTTTNHFIVPAASSMGYDLKIHLEDEDGDIRIAMVGSDGEKCITYVRPDALIGVLINVGLPVERTFVPPKGLGAVVASNDCDGTEHSFVRAATNQYGWVRDDGKWFSERELVKHKNLKVLSEGVRV